MMHASDEGSGTAGPRLAGRPAFAGSQSPSAGASGGAVPDGRGMGVRRIHCFRLIRAGYRGRVAGQLRAEKSGVDQAPPALGVNSVSSSLGVASLRGLLGRSSPLRISRFQGHAQATCPLQACCMANSRRWAAEMAAGKSRGQRRCRRWRRRRQMSRGLLGPACLQSH